MIDFDKIVLNPQEKCRLFSMRFYRRANAKYLGRYVRNLLRLGFIMRNVSQKGIDENGVPDYDGTYSLTRKYYRYCTHRREKFFYGTFWPLIVSAVVSSVWPSFESRVLPAILAFFRGLIS